MDYVVKNQKILRTGVTTGSCAAAAAQAAASELLLGKPLTMVSLMTPKQVVLSIATEKVERTENRSVYCVTKDSGDDPDVTNGCRVMVTVCKQDWQMEETEFYSQDYPNLKLVGDIGIGRVTKEGLEQAIGQPAINVVPRKMIFQAVGEIAALAEYDGKLEIRVSILEGRELAEKTFNPRLGIEGGLSILGTSGILEPMSEKALVDTIETEIRMRHVQGKDKLLLVPGNYGQTYVSDKLNMNGEECVKCSNYIGDALDLAIAYEMKQVLLVGNFGKLVKLAAGIMNTHSKVADGRGEIVALYTMLCGSSKETAEKILACVNTEAMLAILKEEGIMEDVLSCVIHKMEEYVAYRVKNQLEFAVVVFSENYGFLGQTTMANKLMDEFHQIYKR